MTLKPLKNLLIIIISSLIVSFVSCKQKADNNPLNPEKATSENSQDSLFFKLSLAEWSLHTQIEEGELNPMDFAEKASELGFEGIEYVTSFYADSIKKADDPEARMQAMLKKLKSSSEKFGVTNVLLMIDGEGDLAVSDSIERNKAVENHKKWVDAANYLGCHSIRVNLFGSNDPEEWKANSADALAKLSKYAAGRNVNVLVENHGYLSSNADLLVEVMKMVNMENCGTLPDFGNFCLQRKGGERWDASCIEEYPRYEGVKKMMPYAKAVSAKSYTFNDNGEEETIDYKKMLNIIKDGGYNGFIGVEFEGTDISPEEGILKTKNLLLEAGKTL